MTNRDRNNRSFSDATVQAVWEKGVKVPGNDPAVWRKDSCGKFIFRNSYGNTNSEYGWEVDHIKPVAKGGSDDLSNLQPLQWENNRSKGDDFPQWYCAA